MMMCRIMNITAMSVIIEDIGVRLQPVGGHSSQALIRADVAMRSADLKRHAQWVRIEEFEVVSSRCIVPTVQASAPPIPVTLHSQGPYRDHVQDPSELENLRKSVEDMRNRQEELFELLRATVQSQIPAPTVVVRETPVRVFPPDWNSDPVILPGKMVPDSVEFSVRMREDELPSEDFDSALKALKKAKGK